MASLFERGFEVPLSSSTSIQDAPFVSTFNRQFAQRISPSETAEATMRYSRMKTALLFVFVGGFVVANTWSAILFKLAADYAGKKAVWTYVVGNLIGALGPLALTFALKRGHPNVIYALCFGCSFAAVQIVSS